MWKFNGSRLQEKDSKHLLCDGGIPKFNVIMDEAGFSGCLSVEKSKGKEFLITGACCALYVHQNTEKTNINATTNKYNEAGAEGFKSSAPASLLKEATKQKAVDRQKEKVVLQLLGAGFALLICLEFLQGSFISALEDERNQFKNHQCRLLGKSSIGYRGIRQQKGEFSHTNGHVVC